MIIVVWIFVGLVLTRIHLLCQRQRDTPYLERQFVDLLRTHLT